MRDDPRAARAPGAGPADTGDASRRPLAVAFCPAPPLLHPAVARGAAAETAVLREACAEAVAAVLRAGVGAVVVVGPGAPAGSRYGGGDVGSLRGFGVDLDLPFAGPAGPAAADGRRLPLAHALGGWLLEEAGYRGPRLGVAADDLGAVLDGQPGPVGVLAMGDGSARRTLKAPGYLDEAAGPFDDAVAAALAAGDAAALAALDPAEGERLLAAGTGTWRAVGAALRGRDVAARLRYADAPYGVGYLVADWAAG